MSNLIQEVISESPLILNKLKEELYKANEQIIIAMAWFTNQELFNILVTKSQEGIDISIILSEQVDNEKLDFQYLRDLGADVHIVKNVGWGIMHQKFCVIDRKIAITGSYNWTNNAKNNHESVIYTNHQETVQQLINTFLKIRNRAILMEQGKSINDIENEENSFDNNISIPTSNKVIKTEEVANPQSLIKNYERILDEMIAIDISSFSEERLIDQAYQRAKENNGDHQVIRYEMESLYLNLRREIEDMEEKKREIKAQIDTHKVACVSNIEQMINNDIRSYEDNYLLEKQKIENSVLENEKEIEKKRLLIDSNNNTEIPALEKTITDKQKEVQNLSLENIKPPINWFAFALVSIFIIAICIYIVVFYSSVAYILVFSQDEYDLLLKKQVTHIPYPEVFDPKVIEKASQRGFYGLSFIFLFPLIPISLGLIQGILSLTKSSFTLGESNINKSSYWSNFLKNNSFLIIVLVVDFIIAYKVATIIHSIKNLINKSSSNIEIGFWSILKNESFYLVLILGALGIFLLNFFFNTLCGLINERNETLQRKTLKHKINIIEEEITTIAEKIKNIRLENNTLESEIEILKKDIASFNNRLTALPQELNIKISDSKNQFILLKERLNTITQTVIGKIDTDRIPIPVNEIENRINIFTKGWGKYLYETYSDSKAEAKLNEALSACEIWSTNSLKSIK